MWQQLLLLVAILFPFSSQGLPSSSTNDCDEVNEIRDLPPFGRAMRQEFLFKSDFINLNHGSYGKYPRVVRQAMRAFQDRAEGNVDLWIRRDAEIEMNKIHKQLAQLLNAAAEDIVMVPNDTGGLNAIFRSMVFKKPIQILYGSNIYNSILSILEYVRDYSNGLVSLLQFNITYPISNDEIVSSLELFIDKNNSPDNPIGVALIEHISSVPSVIMPIERIIPILKKRNIVVVIDGAHAIGHIPIDLSKLAPDYYVSSCNKWLYAPRNSAVLFVDKKHQGKTHPTHIAWNYAQPAKFQAEFFRIGTWDYAPHLSLTAALEFRRALGGENAIQEYNHGLAVQAGKYLAERFKTEVLHKEEQMGSMVDIRLPIEHPENERITPEFWTDTLLTRFPQLYAHTYKHGGNWWVRVAAQIYNDLSDYEVAANIFLTICAEINSNVTNSF